MEAGISQQLSKRLLIVGGVGSILKPVLLGLSVKCFYSQDLVALGKGFVQLVSLRSMRQ